MNILQLVSSGGFYGIESMLLGLAEGLQNQGENVTVGVFQNSQNPNLEIADALQKKGIAVEIIRCGGRADRRAVGEIRKIIRKHSIQVVHAHGFKADLYALAATRSTKTPLMATCHNWPGTSWTLKAYAALDRWALRHFSRVVILSEQVATRLRGAGVNSERIMNIPTGINTMKFTGRKPVPGLRTGQADELVVGCVGRLVPEKGCAILLRAAAQIVPEFPLVRFVFVGEGPERPHLESLSRELNIDRSVYFAGRREDMPEVYAAFDLCVLPSFVEAMPMTILEAMASGNSVVSTRVGEIPRMVAHDVTGILVQPNQVTELRDAILRLLRDPELRRAMGENGQKRVGENFSLERMSQTYIGLYKEIAKVTGATEKLEAFAGNTSGQS